MNEFISAWFRRYFSHPQAVLLLVLLVTGFGIVLVMGDMLAPVLASVVIAYLLEGLVGMFERRGARLKERRVYILEREVPPELLDEARALIEARVHGGGYIRPRPWLVGGEREARGERLEARWLAA